MAKRIILFVLMIDSNVVVNNKGNDKDEGKHEAEYDCQGNASILSFLFIFKLNVVGVHESSVVILVDDR